MTFSPFARRNCWYDTSSFGGACAPSGAASSASHNTTTRYFMRLLWRTWPAAGSRQSAGSGQRVRRRRESGPAGSRPAAGRRPSADTGISLALSPAEMHQMKHAHTRRLRHFEPLSRLGDFQVEPHQADPRGWNVLSPDGRTVGEVKNLTATT